METVRMTGLLIIVNVIVFLIVFSMPQEMGEAVFQNFSF